MMATVRGQRTASISNPNVLAGIGCLVGFWWFLKRATDDVGADTPGFLKWIRWW